MSPWNIASGFQNNRTSTTKRQNPAAGEDLSITLRQIPHDLETNLLEFKLMTDAREREVGRIQMKDEAERATWSLKEVRRTGDEVRNENVVRVFRAILVSKTNCILLVVRYTAISLKHYRQKPEEQSKL